MPYPEQAEQRETDEIGADHRPMVHQCVDQFARAGGMLQFGHLDFQRQDGQRNGEYPVDQRVHAMLGEFE
jgi:hypothetical protein